MEQILEGLQILSKYGPKGDFSAGHDQIWAGDENDKSVTDMSEKDRKRMEELGWFIDDDFECWSHFA